MLGIFSRCTAIPLRERIGEPLAVLVLLLFIGFGIDAVIHPLRHMNAHSRSGGEMRRDLAEVGVQFGGLLFIGFSGWALKELVLDIWDRCFG
jgi:hypothetical protein